MLDENELRHKLHPHHRKPWMADEDARLRFVVHRFRPAKGGWGKVAGLMRNERTTPAYSARWGVLAAQEKVEEANRRHALQEGEDEEDSAEVDETYNPAKHGDNRPWEDWELAILRCPLPLKHRKNGQLQHQSRGQHTTDWKELVARLGGRRTQGKIQEQLKKMKSSQEKEAEQEQQRREDEVRIQNKCDEIEDDLATWNGAAGPSSLAVGAPAVAAKPPPVNRRSATDKHVKFELDDNDKVVVVSPAKDNSKGKAAQSASSSFSSALTSSTLFSGASRSTTDGRNLSRKEGSGSGHVSTSPLSSLSSLSPSPAPAAFSDPSKRLTPNPALLVNAFKATASSSQPGTSSAANLGPSPFSSRSPFVTTAFANGPSLFDKGSGVPSLAASSSHHAIPTSTSSSSSPSAATGAAPAVSSVPSTTSEIARLSQENQELKAQLGRMEGQNQVIMEMLAKLTSGGSGSGVAAPSGGEDAV